MRASYGKKLRGFFSKKVNTRSLLDFGMAQNFGAATTYTCILSFSSSSPQKRLRTCYASDDRAAMADPKAYFETNSVLQSSLDDTPWVVLSKKRQEIKRLAEKEGLRLEKWSVNVSLGIRTGLNEAFYLTEEERDLLLDEDPSSDDLIVKLVRGRDIQSYHVDWDHAYQLIVRFGAHKDLRERYPAVFRHLSTFKDRLAARGQCQYSRAQRQTPRTDSFPGQHHWLELDNNPTEEYLNQFRENKIIYPEITKWMGFYFDRRKRFFPNNKGFIINGDDATLAYLTGFFNSSLFRCAFRDNFPELMGNTYELRKNLLEQVPIKPPPISKRELFVPLVDLVQCAFDNDETGASSFLSDLADACVMECYFHDHMAERDLLVLDDLAREFDGIDPTARDSKQIDFLEHFVKSHNAPEAPIRNRLLRMSADSPELLAVIKEEGRV